eukprot:GILI01023165.1.p1 GENE.GILI01023165.1~~GILI01023165.1.p1  ORF type:complete len:247 (-),score=45.00 GILI01023165.1:67-771(-)
MLRGVAGAFRVLSRLNKNNITPTVNGLIRQVPFNPSCSRPFSSTVSLISRLELAQQHAEQGKLSDAASEFSLAIEQATSENLPPNRISAIRLARAELFKHMKQYDNAIADAKEVAKCQHYGEFAFLLMSEIYRTQGDLSSAISTLNDASKAFPNSITVKYSLGMLYVNDARLPEALANLEESLQLAESQLSLRSGDMQFAALHNAIKEDIKEVQNAAQRMQGLKDEMNSFPTDK